MEGITKFLLSDIEKSKYECIYIGIGTSARKYTLEEYDDDMNQLYPIFMRTLYKDKQKLLVHFDEQFNLNNQQEFIKLYLNSNEFQNITSGIWYSPKEKCKAIIVSNHLSLDERFDILNKISRTTLKTNAKIIAQEFSGRELVPSFKQFFQQEFSLKEKEILRNNVVWDITYGQDCHCMTPLTQYKPIMKDSQNFFNIWSYSNEELINYINYSPGTDKILYEHFYKQFRKIIDTHHVNYRRKLLGDTLLTSTDAYNENSPPYQIMEYIIKELDPMIRILFRMSSMTQIQKDSFTFKLISYKNYDPYKWYKEIINGIKV
jgi:hypothetical protein